MGWSSSGYAKPSEEQCESAWKHRPRGRKADAVEYSWRQEVSPDGSNNP